MARPKLVVDRYSYREYRPGSGIEWTFEARDDVLLVSGLPGDDDMYGAEASPPTRVADVLVLLKARQRALAEEKFLLKNFILEAERADHVVAVEAECERDKYEEYEETGRETETRTLSRYWRRD